MRCVLLGQCVGSSLVELTLRGYLEVGCGLPGLIAAARCQPAFPDFPQSQVQLLKASVLCGVCSVR